MAKMTMEEFLNTITTSKSPLNEQGQPDNAAVAAQIRAVMERKLPLLAEPDKQQDILKNLWTLNGENFEPVGDLGPDPYEALARRVADGEHMVLPLSWTQGRDGLIPDATLYRATPGKDDLLLIGGGSYQGQFYLQAMDQDEASSVMNVACPLKEPGFWDKFVDFFMSIFHSRDQVCAQWEDYYGLQPQAQAQSQSLDSNTQRTREELRITKGIDMREVLQEPDWNIPDGIDMLARVQSYSFIDPFYFGPEWAKEPADIYKNLLQAIQVTACEDICSKEGAMALVRQNPRMVTSLMKDLKAYVFEHVTAEDVNGIIAGDRECLAKFNRFGKDAYAQYKKEVAEAVRDNKETLPETGLLRHESVKDINPITSIM